MDTARIVWGGKRLFVGTDGAGHSLVMDAQAAYGGDGAGVRPVELVLHGLAGCTGMDVISILEKKRQDVRGFEIVVTGEPRTDEQPKYYERMHVLYRVTGYGVDAAAVARAIELSEEKYCSVRAMLAEVVEVTTSFEVLQSRPAGEPLKKGEAE